jgi:hypothetical protein
MSFILDALKRSERARRVLGASEAPPAVDPPPPARRGWALGAVLLLLLANAALLGWWLLRSDPAPTAAVAPAAGEVRSLAREAGDTGTAAAVDPGTVAPSRAEYAASSASATPLAEVEPALRMRLETLHVDVHGWADDPAQRFVIINLKRRVAGDALEGGATLVEIVVDGAVVELDGRRVLLPRQ